MRTMKLSFLTHEAYYRLPWNLADNAITWLEPQPNAISTAMRLSGRGSGWAQAARGRDQRLEEINRSRTTDGISIAGGERLLYPHIVDLVRYVASQDWKPIIITNGTMLNAEIIRELKEAGLVGFTVHVDSHQHRPGSNDDSEEDLNELRTRLAEMIHEAGNGRISCSFNVTVYPDTIEDVAALTRWAQEHIDLVHTLVFILFRSLKVDDRFDCYVAGRKLDPGEVNMLRYNLSQAAVYEHVTIPEVVEGSKACPTYQASAFLNSNQDGSTIKWLLALRVGRKDKILG